MENLYYISTFLSYLNSTINPEFFPYTTCIGFPILSGRLTGGSIVGSIAPHQAFAIGGPSSVRGYGEGAAGSGQSCVVSKSELTFPLVYAHYC